MPNSRDSFRELTRARLDEARVLHKSRHWSGSYHLTGIAVECALKACISKQTRRFEFPDKKKVIDSHTHDLGVLLKLAGIEPELRTVDKKIATNWATVKDWSIESRYVVVPEADATDLMVAVTARRYGVMQWLRQHW
jgi:HEPN domain-containing protein